jgi:hypothetical protein
VLGWKGGDSTLGNGILFDNLLTEKGVKMQKTSLCLMTLMLVFGLAVSAQATLIDRGGGMIYSTELNLTWLQDANYAQTSGYDADGLMTWDEAMTWAANLSYGGYTDWRLPTYDPPYQRCDASKLNEMAYLLYIELDNLDKCGGQSGLNYGPFINVLPDGDFNGERWSSTECDSSTVGGIYFGCG